MKTLTRSFTVHRAAAVTLGALLSLGGAAHAEDVEAGPIANNTAAAARCPGVCEGRNMRWTGAWTTTVPGRMSVCNCAAAAPAPAPAPAATLPVAGTWSWFNRTTVTLNADGTGRATNNFTARWRVLDAAARRVEINWNNGQYVDTLTLSEDGRSISGTNQNGLRVSGTKR
ncbi:MAG: mannan-binding lectin [Polyangiales bacterium]